MKFYLDRTRLHLRLAICQVKFCREKNLTFPSTAYVIACDFTIVLRMIVNFLLDNRRRWLERRENCSSAVPSYIRFIPDLIGTNTHCLLTEQPACRCPITIAAVGCTRVLGIRSAVRVIATTWTKADDKLISASWQAPLTNVSNNSPTVSAHYVNVLINFRNSSLATLARENAPVIRGNLDFSRCKMTLQSN